MGKLMEEHGSKKQETGQDSHSPVLPCAPVGMFLRELHGEGKRDQGKNNYPAGVQIDGNSENFADA